MSGTGEFRAQPEAMRSTVGNVGGIIMQGVNAVGDLERTVLAPVSFASFGSAVASANTAMQSQQVTAMRSLLSLLQQVNDLVRRSADEYQAADESTAAGYGGGRTGSAAIWGTPSAAELAGYAMRDGAGTGEPGSVGTVLGYLGQAGLGELGQSPVDPQRFHGVSHFNDWLGGNAENQARIGVIEVYSGTARGLGDIPGGVHGGDVVVLEPLGHSATGAGHQPAIGIAGTGGQLFNHGVIDSEIHGLARVSVYRPASALPLGSAH